MEKDDLGKIIEDCGKILDESMGILADVEFELDSSKEDIVEPSMTRRDLADMAHEVADSVRVRKAEASFIRRHLETGPGN